MINTNKIKKSTLMILFCVIPLGTFAHEIHKKYDYKYAEAICDKEKFIEDKYFDIENEVIFFDDKFIEEKGVNFSFEGKVSDKPKNSYNGIWTISGQEIIVNDDTIFLMDDNIEIINEVEVYAKRENGKIKAILIGE